MNQHRGGGAAVMSRTAQPGYCSLSNSQHRMLASERWLCVPTGAALK